MIYDDIGLLLMLEAYVIVNKSMEAEMMVPCLGL